MCTRKRWKTNKIPQGRIVTVPRLLSLLSVHKLSVLVFTLHEYHIETNRVVGSWFFFLFFYRNMIAWWNSLIWQILHRIFGEREKIISIISKERRVSFYDKKKKENNKNKKKKNKKRSVYDETSSTVVVRNKSTSCLWETRGSSLYAKYLPALLFCKRNFSKTWFEKRSHPFCSAGLCNETFAPVSTIMYKYISYFFFGGRLSSEFSFPRTFNDVSKATEAWTF